MYVVEYLAGVKMERENCAPVISMAWKGVKSDF
jgi:hypothetical protein